jgi:NAD(P)-dependent dehydrogenase (short-subunit alcohol dehydrogenase family)
VLFNNAGVSLPPLGSVSKQNHELQLATNCLGPYLFTQLLIPTPRATTAHAEVGHVRVIWTSSQMVDLAAMQGGLDVANITTDDQAKNYTMTKVGNWFLASELAKQCGSDGILSVSQNPGNLKTNLLRHAPTFMRIVTAPLLYPAERGACTELWAGLSEELTMETNGSYIIPWGRLHPAPRPDLVAALESKEEGGTGQAKMFMEWCDSQVSRFKRWRMATCASILAMHLATSSNKI